MTELQTRTRRRAVRPTGPPPAEPVAVPHGERCTEPEPRPVWWAHPAGTFLPLWRCPFCGAAWPREADQ